jgi:thiol-disulfide isomerase/thioredoxin
MRKYIALCFLCLLLTKFVTAQSPHDYPEIGKPCPDFTLSEVHQFKDTKVSLHSLKGKPLIIDFFEQYCISCFEAFPRLDSLQKQFKDQIQVFLVGYDKKFFPHASRNIRQDYQNFQHHFDLNLPVAYDTMNIQRFKIMQFSYVVWIDAGGVVKAITHSDVVTSENIRKFLAGDSLNLPLAENTEQAENDTLYKPEKPLLSNGNGGTDSEFVYRSVIMNWKYNQGIWHDLHLSSENIKEVKGTGFALFYLYKMAYGDTLITDFPPARDDTRPNKFGEWYLNPILETKDSAMFKPDFTTAKNVYSYDLTVPESKTVSEMQERMKYDLKSYFGFEVRVEERQLPYWRLVATTAGRKKLATKNTRPMLDYSQSEFTFINQPMSILIYELWSCIPHEVVIDETGSQGNIDIQINAILTDFSDLRKALQAQGLDLVPGEREMKALVFRDPQRD